MPLAGIIGTAAVCMVLVGPSAELRADNVPPKKAQQPPQFELPPSEVELEILLPRREACRDLRQIQGILLNASKASGASDALDPDRARSAIDRAELALAAYFDSKVPPLRREAQRLAVDLGPYTSPDMARSFATLIASRNSTVLGFESLERDLLRHVVEELGLDDACAEAVERRRLKWTRGRYRELRCDLIPSRIDLEDLVARVASDDGAVRDDLAFQAVLLGYSEEVTSLLSQWVRLRLRAMADDATKAMEHGDDQESFLVARRRIAEPAMRVERLIVESTREWAGRIAEALHRGAADRFTAAFMSASYPIVHPNPFGIEGLRAAVTEGSLPPEISESLLESLQSFDVRIAEVDRQMEAICLRASEEWGLMRTGGMPTAESLRAALEHLVRRRRSLAREALALVEDAGVPPEAAEVSALRSRIERDSGG